MKTIKTNEAGKRCVTTLILLVMGLLAWAPPAGAWWNEQWQYRKKIAFNTKPTGADLAENLTEVPLLIRLHTGNFNFGNAKENGEDLRFVQGDDQTLLKHHIEKYDSLEEMALVWVRLPKLAGNSDQEFIYLYYGNAEAMGGQDPVGTYGPMQAAVFHFGPPEGYQDVTANKNQFIAAPVGAMIPANIGDGASFSGAGDSFSIQASPSLDFSKGFAIACWVRIAAPQQGLLFSRTSPQGRLDIGIDQTKVYCRVVKADGKTYLTEESAELTLQNWNQLVVTGAGGGVISVYLDGVKTYYMQLPGGLPALSGDLIVGAGPDQTDGFVGELDEVQLYSQALTDGWVRAMYANQGPDGRLMNFDVEMMPEKSGFLQNMHLSTILKNITLDGWVIIGFLGVMGFLGWIVILSKSFTIYLANKDNKAFIRAFAGHEDILALNTDQGDFDNAPIFRIYRTGCRTLHQWLGKATSENEKLSPKKIEGVRSALERSLMDETNSLNAWLMILTMCISGGPFLGLLGTVWGVMTTFAALAESGEANLAAIAPGVASALSTTVFGLIVAIPALFGYNYLASRVKQATIDLSVFVDDFGLKIDLTYGGGHAA